MFDNLFITKNRLPIGFVYPKRGRFQALRQLKNFNALLAVLSALDSGPVRRLTWPTALKEQLAEQVRIMDSRQSFANYRTALSSSQPPCIPYL